MKCMVTLLRGHLEPIHNKYLLTISECFTWRVNPMNTVKIENVIFMKCNGAFSRCATGVKSAANNSTFQ